MLKHGNYNLSCRRTTSNINEKSSYVFIYVLKYLCIYVMGYIKCEIVEFHVCDGPYETWKIRGKSGKLLIFHFHEIVGTLP